MYEIENGIEAPEKHRGREPKYPWRELEIGDSFFVAAPNGRSISSSAWHAQRRYGFTLVVRTREENGVKGVRVWRIE